MPRGKHNVNQNRGVHLMPHKKSDVRKIECSYGYGCTRLDCIYMHSNGREIDNFEKSEESREKMNECRSKQPCMAFLSGQCKFTAAGCRKFHPNDPEEINRLISKYKMIKCQFGEACRTKGCLYGHPNDEISSNVVDTTATYTPSRMSLGGSIYFSQPDDQHQYNVQIHPQPMFRYSQHQGEYQFKGAGSQPLPHQQQYHEQHFYCTFPQRSDYAHYHQNMKDNLNELNEYEHEKNSKLFTNDDFPAL